MSDYDLTTEELLAMRGLLDTIRHNRQRQQTGSVGRAAQLDAVPEAVLSLFGPAPQQPAPLGEPPRRGMIATVCPGCGQVGWVTRPRRGEPSIWPEDGEHREVCREVTRALAVLERHADRYIEAITECDDQGDLTVPAAERLASYRSKLWRYANRANAAGRPVRRLIRLKDQRRRDGWRGLKVEVQEAAYEASRDKLARLSDDVKAAVWGSV